MFTNRGKALTFDDILLIPGYSDITPDAVDIATWLTPSIPLRIPLLSAAMDTVTESAMAISMARMGGIGIIHKNMPVARQRLEVERVKKSESGMILDPVTISPNNTVQDALDLMSDFRVSGLPVVEDGRLVGILTNRDVRFIEDGHAVRVREPHAERPFRVPFYPVVPLLFAGVCGYMLWSSLVYVRTGALVGVGVLALGALLLWWLERVSRTR